MKKKKKRKPVSHVSRRRKKKSSSKRREWTRAEHIVFLRGNECFLGRWANPRYHKMSKEVWERFGCVEKNRRGAGDAKRSTNPVSRSEGLFCYFLFWSWTDLWSLQYFLYLSQGTRNEDSLFHIKLKGLSEADQKVERERMSLYADNCITGG